jgi:hypothetical protein
LQEKLELELQFHISCDVDGLRALWRASSSVVTLETPTKKNPPQPLAAFFLTHEFKRKSKKGKIKNKTINYQLDCVLSIAVCSSFFSELEGKQKSSNLNYSLSINSTPGSRLPLKLKHW